MGMVEILARSIGWPCGTGLLFRVACCLNDAGIHMLAGRRVRCWAGTAH